MVVVRGLPEGSFVTARKVEKALASPGRQARRLLFWGWRPRAEVEQHREQLIAKVRWQLWAADTRGFFERMVAEVIHMKDIRSLRTNIAKQFWIDNLD